MGGERWRSQRVGDVARQQLGGGRPGLPGRRNLSQPAHRPQPWQSQAPPLTSRQNAAPSANAGPKSSGGGAPIVVHAARAHPTEEHFLPLHVAIGATDDGEAATVLEGQTTFGIINMESYGWGLPH